MQIYKALTQKANSHYVVRQFSAKQVRRQYLLIITDVYINK